MKCSYSIGVIAIVCLAVSACSTGVREAQETVAQADSLRAEGRLYDDSVRLSEAYETLGRWQWRHADSYVHACYHYGRLLRSKEQPAEAMQCFINATHTRSDDYYMLGRVYSNMGSIAHIAGEYGVSYDMYARCAECFLKSGDTALYYYGLNNMAFELTEQGKAEETLALLAEIERDCADENVLHKTCETKAELHLICTEQYDSVLYYANKMLAHGHCEPNGLLLKAQAFSYLGMKDSATFYAGKVMACATSPADKNNSLAILTHDDESKDEQALRETAVEQTKVNQTLETRRGKTSQAVQLLQQDLTRRPDRRWWYIAVTLVISGGALSIWFHGWRRQKKVRREHIEELEKVCQLIHNSADIRAELAWSNYEQMCKTANMRLFGIIDRLQSYALSEKEMRLCVLVMVQASTKQMVDWIPYAQSGLGKFKYTLARKLGTNTSELRTFLLHLTSQTDTFMNISQLKNA